MQPDFLYPTMLNIPNFFLILYLIMKKYYYLCTEFGFSKPETSGREPHTHGNRIRKFKKDKN